MSDRIIPIDVLWSERVSVNGRYVSIGHSTEPAWYAAHEKPYFCFEGASRLEVIDLAGRALTWYDGLTRS